MCPPPDPYICGPVANIFMLGFYPREAKERPRAELLRAQPEGPKEPVPLFGSVARVLATFELLEAILKFVRLAMVRLCTSG